MAIQECGLNLNRDGKEQQAHGTFDFPCAVYAAVYTDSPENSIPWHYHDDLEVMYLESGCMKVQIPGKTFHLKAGDGLVINANVLHFAVAEPLCELHSLVFHPRLVAGSSEAVFSIKYLTPLVNNNVFDGWMIPGDSDSRESFAVCFKAAFTAMDKAEVGFEFVVREALSQICLRVYQAFQAELEVPVREVNQDHMRLRQMLDFIHAHYAEDMELAAIARAADIGERECLRCFQRVIQISPVQYLLKYRVMQGASALLERPDSSVSEIARQCGFDSPSNFAQMFKRFFLCTPREYRKNA